MEHLDLTLGRDIKIEYHGNKYNAEHSFQNFPGKQPERWKLNTSSGKLKPEDPNEIGKKDFKKRYSQFMQSWLFFGLIAAVVYDDYGRNFDHKRLVQDRQRVNTKELPEMLKEWRAWEMDPANTRGRKMRMIRAQFALDLARKVVTANCSLDNLELEGDPDWQGPMVLKPELAMSLMLIGETLSNAKARIIKEIGFHVRGWYGDTEDGWGTPKAVVGWMKEEGWCPRTIKLLRAQLRNNATAILGVYASHRNTKPFKGHDRCKEHEACKAWSQHISGSEDYATRHHPECLHGKGTNACIDDGAQAILTSQTATDVEHPCFGKSKEKEKTHDAPTCHTPCNTMFGVLDMKDVIDLINADKIPLLKLTRSSTKGEQLELELTDHTQCPEYATISHVWSDGYGNIKKNKLYQCQLQYFNRLLKWAQRSRLLHREGQGYDDPEPLPFWMDTLVIPVEDKYKDARAKAIGQIYNVFSKARYTIVVDNGLNDMTWDGKDYTTTAMQILASGWMRRLWTLQEAFLSRKLLFAFKSSGQDTLPLVDLDAIEDLYDETETKLISNLPATAQSYYNNLLGPDRKARIHKLTSTNGVGLIASVWRAAQWRTTSHREHETLALATLLNLKSENASFGMVKQARNDIKFTAELDAMMRRFWLALEENSPGAIPPGIIFLPGRRIKEQGFGWAPTTWMSAHGIDHPDPISLISRPATLATQNRGLSVEYPGFLLHYQDRNAVLGTTDGTGFWFPSDNTLTEWYHAESADDKNYSPNKGNVIEGRSEDLAIILCRPRPRQIAEIGLLVEIHETIEQTNLGKDDVKRIFAVYILRRITLKRELLEKTIQKKRTEILQSRRPENQAKIICGEVLEEDQRWYVDCRITSVKEEDSQAAQSTSGIVQTETSGAREIPYGYRGATDTGAQADSERETSRVGTEADVSDEAGTTGLPGAGNHEEASVQSNVEMPPAASNQDRDIDTNGSGPAPGINRSRTTGIVNNPQDLKSRIKRTLTGFLGN